MAEGNLSSGTPPDVAGEQPRRVTEASATAVARDERPATGAAMETLATLKTLEAHRSSLRPVVVSSPEYRSFSQLLAGAMASPVGSPAAVPAILTVPVDGVRLPMVAVPCFVAPASPGFAGQFAMTHQAVLATVTAQAQMQMHANAMHPPSSELSTNTFSQQILSTISPLPLQQRPPHLHEDSVCSLDQKPKSAQTVVNTNPVGDGFNWRKYGQKQVKGSENSRSYYKCTNPNCLAKKKVERCPDGPSIEVYRGQHNHDPPQQTRCSRERGPRSSVTLGESDGSDIQNTEIHSQDFSNAKMDQTFGNGTSEQQLFCSSDCEGDAGIKTEEELGIEPESKRRLIENIVTCSAPSPRIVREHKIVVQAESDAGRAGDGYKWRKYGQKLVKGNPNPRSYYRCTHNGCPVRKHVERASDDEKAIIITYEGKHNHDQPGPKNSSDPPPPPSDPPPPPSPLPPVAAVLPDEQSHPSDNSSDTKISVLLLTDIKEGSTIEKVPGLEREKALDSAQALVTIGLNSTSGDNDQGTNSDGVKSIVLVENNKISSIEGS